MYTFLNFTSVNQINGLLHPFDGEEAKKQNKTNKEKLRCALLDIRLSLTSVNLVKVFSVDSGIKHTDEQHE